MYSDYPAMVKGVCNDPLERCVRLAFREWYEDHNAPDDEQDQVYFPSHAELLLRQMDGDEAWKRHVGDGNGRFVDYAYPWDGDEAWKRHVGDGNGRFVDYAYPWGYREKVPFGIFGRPFAYRLIFGRGVSGEKGIIPEPLLWNWKDLNQMKTTVRYSPLRLHSAIKFDVIVQDGFAQTLIFDSFHDLNSVMVDEAKQDYSDLFYALFTHSPVACVQIRDSSLSQYQRRDEILHVADYISRFGWPSHDLKLRSLIMRLGSPNRTPFLTAVACLIFVQKARQHLKYDEKPVSYFSGLYPELDLQ